MTGDRSLSTIRLLNLLLFLNLFAAASCTGGGEEVEPAVNAGGEAAPEGREATPEAAVEQEAGSEAATVEDGGLTAEEAERLVRADLARELDIAEAHIRTVEAARHTWPDAALGCELARRVVLEGQPVDGYQIVLAVGEEVYDYRADAEGNFRRCMAAEEVGKPLDPIR